MVVGSLTHGVVVDTTWSAVGASLWHLATHPEDRDRLVAEPDLMPTAVEELLHDPSGLAEMRRAGRAYVEREHSPARLRELLAEVLE